MDGFKRELAHLKGVSRHDDAMHSLWILASMEGLILDVGGHVQLITKWRPIELIGKNVGILIPSELQAAHHIGLEKVRQGGVVRKTGITGDLITQDGTKVPSATFLGIVEHHGERCVRAENFELSPQETKKE